MDYRALEDLIGILVKKSGYKLNEYDVKQDNNYLNNRKAYLLEEIEILQSKLDNSSYIDKEKKQKYLDEKKYLEEELNNLILHKNDLESKLEEKNIKNITKCSIQSELDIILNELERIEDSIKLVNFKLESKDYIDTYSKSKDTVLLSSLKEEVKYIEKILSNNLKHPSLLSINILDSFKNGKPYNEVKEDIDLLATYARNNYNHTLNEIKGSNIFELIDTYSIKKKSLLEKIEKDSYCDDKLKEELFEKTKYNIKRIETFKNTINGIEKRKEELTILINESTSLYEQTRKERLEKESKLDNLIIKLYSEINLTKDFDDIINNLRTEIVNDKYLENKYNQDIQAYKDEIRNLDINYNNLHNEIMNEERSLEIINERIDSNTSLFEKLEDKVDLLLSSNRINSLTNEQQYLYVNVDVILEEIESLWNKNNNNKSTSMYEIEEPTEEITSNEETTIEDIEELDYLD